MVEMDRDRIRMCGRIGYYAGNEDTQCGEDVYSSTQVTVLVH